MEISKNIFEKKIKPIFTYVGFIGSILMLIAYIIAVCILIFGFESDMKLSQILAFAILNGVAGLLVMFFLKVQGKDFAKNLPENKAISDEYYKNETKEKKTHSMVYFWVKTTITDVVTKALTVILSTTLLIKIVVDAIGDMSLLGMAIVNIIMFFCFGLLSLVKAYDFYNDYQVPYMKKELEKAGKILKNEPKNGIIISEEREEKPHE